MAVGTEALLLAAKMHQMLLKGKTITGHCVLWDRRRITQMKIRTWCSRLNNGCCLQDLQRWWSYIQREGMVKKTNLKCCRGEWGLLQWALQKFIVHSTD